MNLDDLTLGQLRQIKALVDGNCAPSKVFDHGIKIVVLDRGFVYVGHTTTDNEWCRVTSARNIRLWGTSKGLGELRNGPLTNTKCDPCGDIQAPMKSVIFLMDVEAAKWQK